MKIRLANTVEPQQGEQENISQLRFQTGLISSALEHAVPEQMFSDPENPTDGVSAVKALQIAASQGQKIFQIDESNVDAVLTEITLDAAVESEIRDAVAAGRVVITHTGDISVPGWTGAGYILLDQETGVGSYKISGGGNGGFIQGVLFANLLMLTFAVVVVSLGPVGIAGASIIASLLVPTLVATGLALIFNTSNINGTPDPSCFLSGFLWTVGLVGIAAAFGGIGIPQLGQLLIAAFATLSVVVEPTGPQECLFGE